MKFYRIQNHSKDVGRFYLASNGTGRMEIDGYPRPLEIVGKVSGEPWGYAAVDATELGLNLGSGQVENEREPHGN